ncbi:Cu(I)-responsive transcriptional regulator [Fluviibacterium sp. DFM31]|uniref:Cu(I)-responsive transcriptional regulator n=1 Tax=Meridianimarinicoccus marinus TaxID=3231483 RepID=A0ABV3L4G6_9RHOB
MNIGDAAKASGLPSKTIRYYEDIGLLVPPRTANGYRDFGPREINILTFLARARALGFTIEECRALLALWQDTDRSSADVRRIAQTHLEEIDRKIADLRDMRATLAHLVHCCAGDDRPDCPILDSLARGDPAG